MYRILLVDDEILVRDAIKENIDWKSLDCELVGDCENGKQASEFVKEHPVDIVLTDILLRCLDCLLSLLIELVDTFVLYTVCR